MQVCVGRRLYVTQRRHVLPVFHSFIPAHVQIRFFRVRKRHIPTITGHVAYWQHVRLLRKNGTLLHIAYICWPLKTL